MAVTTDVLLGEIWSRRLRSYNFQKQFLEHNLVDH